MGRTCLTLFLLPSWPALHLASVSVQNAHQGLVSPTVQDRLPYLDVLHQVMCDWIDYPEHHIARLPRPTSQSPEVEIMHYEYALARFYTQMYFCYFGRAAIIPATLPLIT